MSIESKASIMAAWRVLSKAALKARAVALGVWASGRLGDTYPLSITRAATSSILMEKILLALSPYFPLSPLVLKVFIYSVKGERGRSKLAYLP